MFYRKNLFIRYPDVERQSAGNSENTGPIRLSFFGGSKRKVFSADGAAGLKKMRFMTSEMKNIPEVTHIRSEGRADQSEKRKKCS